MISVETKFVTYDEINLRLDKWFRKHYPSLPHNRLEKLLRDGNIRVDGCRCKSNLRLAEGQEIRIPPLANRNIIVKKAKSIIPQKKFIDLILNSIIYKDEKIIVLNKPPGVAVQGGSKQKEHIDGMLDYLKFDYKTRPKLVHRIDKATSGILVLARLEDITVKLMEAFKKSLIEKIYWAIVIGKPDKDVGIIDASLIKQTGKHFEKMEVNFDLGKRSLTEFRVISGLSNKFTWIELRPKTGRTHQLRAHCSYIGTPILGDGKYGGKLKTITNINGKELFLLARGIRINLNDINEKVFYAPLPKHMKDAFEYLGFDESEGHSFD